MKSKNTRRPHDSSRAKSSQEKPLPWKQMLLGVSLVFLTGVMFLMQNLGSYFQGSIVGQPTTLLSGYTCPVSDQAFAVSPVPDLFSYTKGNTEANRKEILRINKKNHGLTAWYSYDKGFNEAAKAKLIDIMAYETNPNQWLSRIYEEIKNDGSPHGSVDFVTKWLSPDNHNLKTVFPYDRGLVVTAESGHAGYGNYVSVCTDVVTSNGNKMRILYNVAHMNALSVSEGQTITAGTELGPIGSTGNSTTPHAHITIHPDLVWNASYRTMYNAGYNFYYSTTAAETLVKTIDPIAIMLNPSLAYSVVSDSAKAQALFSNPTQYIASLGSALAFDGNVADLSSASLIDEPAPRFEDFKISVVTDSAKVDEWITVTVEAIDQNGEAYPAFSENIDVVLSTTTAQFDNVQAMSGGSTTFKVTDSVPGELIIQVGNSGTITEEKKVSFLDRLKYLEVTAPQKTTVGKTLAVVLRPIGTRGGVVMDNVSVASTVFPQIQTDQTFTIASGRGEYAFSPKKEGVYELRFTADGGIQEKIFIAVEKPVVDVVEEPVVVDEKLVASTEDEIEVPQDTEEDVNDEEEGTEETGETEDKIEESDEDLREDEAEEGPNDKVQGPEESDKINEIEVPSSDGSGQNDIEFLTGTEYRTYEIDGMTTMVFNDANVTSEFPVEMKFTVPTGTETVSIFTGLNDRNFPATGELKLSKYTPGQESIRYYPKYVPEDTYKKVVAYKGGAVLAEKVFTWSPASLHVFTDVVEGVTDDEVLEAVQLLKTAEVVKGNPDGSYGVETPINRAATATILIRAFYADVDLNTLSVPSIDFDDVPLDAWYASAIWFASQDVYQSEVKPVIIKGYQGNANPDGNVKIEEFVTMLLRLLEVQIPETEPWYEGSISKAIELGLMTEAERSFIDQPLSRGLVARIMVKAMKVAEELIEEGALDAEIEEDSVEDVVDEVILEFDTEVAPAEESEEVADATGGPEEENLVVESDIPESVSNLTGIYDDDKLKLAWESQYAGPFSIYRETVGGNGEIFIGNTGGKSFVDVSASEGKSYYYRVEYEAVASKRGEVLVEL